MATGNWVDSVQGQWVNSSLVVGPWQNAFSGLNVTVSGSVTFTGAASYNVYVISVSGSLISAGAIIGALAPGVTGSAISQGSVTPTLVNVYLDESVSGSVAIAGNALAELIDISGELTLSPGSLLFSGLEPSYELFSIPPLSGVLGTNALEPEVTLFSFPILALKGEFKVSGVAQSVLLEVNAAGSVALTGAISPILFLNPGPTPAFLEHPPNQTNQYRPSILVPTGLVIYSLGASNVPANIDVLEGGFAQGISIRQKWRDLQPTQLDYDFSFLDSEIERVGSYGKKIAIRISVQSDNAPDWVMNFAQNFQPADGGPPIWVYWDSFAQNALKSMYAALGARYAAAVNILHVAGATNASGDWSVPHTATDITNWNAIGYTSQKLINAVQVHIDSAIAAFPTSICSMACNRNGNLDPTPDYVCQNLAVQNHATYGNQFQIAKNSLATTTPPPPGNNFYIFTLVPQCVRNVQSLWFTYGDNNYQNNGGVAAPPYTVLSAMQQVAYVWHAKGWEIYQADVLGLQTDPDYTPNPPWVELIAPP